jgi:hypothetical protein
MSSNFLNDSEVLEIAKPLTRCDAVRRWFTRNGYTFKIKPNGMPLITRSHFELVTGGNINSTPQPTDSSQAPDVSALLQFKNKRKAA